MIKGLTQAPRPLVIAKVAAPAAHSSLQDWLAYQETLHPQAIELGLARVAAVAGRLGLPDQGIVTLTVAGTNGKGSSATLAALIYRQAGYRTGLYTSPHLLRYNERVVIDGRAVSDADLCRAFASVEAARGDVLLTYFEFGTLAALWLFRAAGVQVQVLEVGLGGRLDAVNLVDADCALVTQIGLDHQDWLGADRESIGREKAGIYRARRPAICSDPSPPASLWRYAQSLQADWRSLGSDFSFDVGASGWTWRQRDTVLADLPLPGLAGKAQLRNAAGVLAAIASLQARLPVPEHAIRSALPQLRLRGRFERHGRWCFDVAHNGEAAQELADQLIQSFGNRRPWLVLGMLSDKPVEAVAAAFASRVAGAVFVSLPGPRGLSAQALRARAANAGLAGDAVDDMTAALQAAEQAALKDGDSERPILVCGSFLTVSAALHALHLEAVQ